MKIILEHSCRNGEFRAGDEITIDPTRGIDGDDYILIMHDDGRLDVCRAVISPQSEVIQLEARDGAVYQSTDVEIAGKVVRLTRFF